MFPPTSGGSRPAISSRCWGRCSSARRTGSRTGSIQNLTHEKDAHEIEHRLLQHFGRAVSKNDTRHLIISSEFRNSCRNGAAPSPWGTFLDIQLIRERQSLLPLHRSTANRRTGAGPAKRECENDHDGQREQTLRPAARGELLVHGQTQFSHGEFVQTPPIVWEGIYTVRVGRHASAGGGPVCCSSETARGCGSKKKREEGR